VPQRAALIAGAIAVAGALTGCNAIFGREVHLADGGGAGDDAPGASETCAAPLPVCAATSRPVVGDWDGNGTDTPGLYDDGRWCVTNAQKDGAVCVEYTWGERGQLPVAGDWNGDGVDTPGVFSDQHWDLQDAEPGGQPAGFSWGLVGMLPLVGDWDRQGLDTPGGIRNLTGNTQWQLSNHSGSGGVDHQFVWGTAGQIDLVGDWDGNGTDTPAAFENGVWRFSNVNTNGGVAATFRWGSSTDLPIVGDWDGDGFDTVGLYRNGMWSLSNEHVSALNGSSGPTAITPFHWGTE
jgi:hypothetical protein